MKNETLMELVEQFSNISDLSFEESMVFLTASQDRFVLNNGEDATILDVINTLNHTANHNAITVSQLVESLWKMIDVEDDTQQLPLEVLVVCITSIAQVTREGGGVIGNSVRGIFSRINKSESAIDELNRYGFDMNKKAENIIYDLNEKWSSLTKEEQYKISLAVAGRFQMSRFMILLDQLDTVS